MEALNDNLENLLNIQEGKKFSLKTVLMIAEQIVNIYIHYSSISFQINSYQG
jgi:hypothetical protein